MIEVRDVAFAYGARRILEAVDLDVGEGELLALVGPNGAGKSTFLRALAGLRPVSHGTIAIDGQRIDRLDARARARTIALIEADGPLPDRMSVRDVVAGGRLPYRAWWRWSSSTQDERAVNAAIALTGIAELAERRFAQLSSGERQRVWIALAVAQDTRVLLLDEPTSHLDIRHTFETLGLVRQLVAGGKSAVVVLHDLNMAAAFADRIAVLGRQRLLACGRPPDVFDEALLSEVYGIAIAVRREADGTVRAFAVAPTLR